MGEEISGFSGVTVIIFIACGVLTFVLLFLFAKREITRFALKNRRGPHVPVGFDAHKALRRDIENRLTRISEFQLEPRSLLVDTIMADSSAENMHRSSLHFYRMKAVDDVKAFEERLREKYPSTKRKSTEPLRSYLLNTIMGASPGSRKTRLIHNLCDIYEHARHSPKVC